MSIPVSYQLQVNISKQGRRFVAYTPALDISTSGTTEKAVRKNFQELVDIFFEEIIENGTAEQVLTELGWKKHQKRWNPPIVSSQFIGINIPTFV